MLPSAIRSASRLSVFWRLVHKKYHTTVFARRSIVCQQCTDAVSIITPLRQRRSRRYASRGTGAPVLHLPERCRSTLALLAILRSRQSPDVVACFLTVLS